MRFLLIGCGNIGAGYDFETDNVATYAKAFHLDPDVEFVVFDSDARVARRVAERYGVRALDRWDELPLGEFDLVAIATPTPTHHRYLARLLDEKPGLIVCEKPVDQDRTRLRQLEAHYRESGMRVLVNYHRRFLPSMARLRDRIHEWSAIDECTSVTVRYQRGFLNNGGHAVDLLGFLLGTPLDLARAQVQRAANDGIEGDPTVDLACTTNAAVVHFVGLAHAEFSHFEIDLFFRRHAVLLRSGGAELEFLAAPAHGGAFHPALQRTDRWSGAMDNYMAHVVGHAKQMLREPAARDNFAESVAVAHAALDVIEQVKR